ncbi:MAG: biotin transporter BioY [Lachnospiraceae bacterium]|nr:biotin transporter BioY [Lachnospiraceae bacterium]
MKEHTTTGSLEKEGIRSVNSMVMIAAMAAVLCVLAPFSLAIPFSMVDISLTNLVLFVIIYVEGFRRATVSYLVYLLVGLAGMPVFSGFGSGFAKVVGPSGGYLIGMIFMTIISGYVIEKTSKQYLHFAGMAVGSIVNYIFGTAWMGYSLGMSFSAALAAGVIPFIPGDLAKMAAACIIGPVLRSRLKKSGVIGRK